MTATWQPKVGDYVRVSGKRGVWKVLFLWDDKTLGLYGGAANPLGQRMHRAARVDSCRPANPPQSQPRPPRRQKQSGPAR